MTNNQSWQCGGCKTWYAPHIGQCGCATTPNLPPNWPLLTPITPVLFVKTGVLQCKVVGFVG